MLTNNRRYDIDWLRVIAIGLLLIYHAAIGFQYWGVMLGFITNDTPWEGLWAPMTMLNVWRIPLLFFVSGMGVYFSMQNRGWKQLLKERAVRIFIPFIFGFFVIVPAQVYVWQYYYQRPLSYSAGPAHLWFLGNIFVYVILFAPVFFYLKKHGNGRVASVTKKILSHPLGLLVVIAAFVAEVLLVNPNPYELYAMTLHGFLLGMLAFFFGFCFAFAGSSFRNMITKWRWLLLAAAALLYTGRLLQFQPGMPNVLLAIESNCWVFTVLAFGGKYLNRPGKTLGYLSKAAYPVYIMHMLFLFLASLVVLPLDIDVRIKFLMVLLITVASCFAFYELVVKRVGVLSILFGLKKSKIEKTIVSKSLAQANL